MSSGSPAMQEVWLAPAARSFRANLGESIQHGDVVMVMPEVADQGELAALLADGVAACEAQRQWSADGKNRFMVSDPQSFGQDTIFRCEEILLRVLDRVDEQLPSVYPTLFAPSDEWASRQPLNAKGARPSVPPPEYLAETCPSLRELYMAGELEWSEGEPAINVYTEQGGFGTHKDHMGLTILMPLTDQFEGGGTGYWSSADEARAEAEGRVATEPTKIIKPPLGSALIFGGDLSHAGMPVESGLRAVFVCSFSTRTDASPADRVAGLQGGGEVVARTLRERNEAARATEAYGAPDDEPAASPSSVGIMQSAAATMAAADASDAVSDATMPRPTPEPPTEPLVLAVPPPDGMEAAIDATAPPGVPPNTQEVNQEAAKPSSAGGKRKRGAAGAKGSGTKGSGGGRSVKERMRQLEELKELGVLSEEDYTAKRADILASL